MDKVEGVVVHYFSAINVDPDNKYDLTACRNLFIDLNLAKAGRKHYMLEDKWPASRMYASAHILIGRDGESVKLVEYDKQAYHAGASILNDRSNCNKWTVGIELVGTIDSGFTAAQYESLAAICSDLMKEHGFDESFIAGHDKVRHAAKADGSTKAYKYDPSGRKDGQGDNFDWKYFRSLLEKQNG